MMPNARLDSITELQYFTYRSSTDSGNNLAISLQFDMDFDLTDADTTFQGRLVFEPYLISGGGWPGFDGNVDVFTIGVQGGIITYDFEP